MRSYVILSLLLLPVPGVLVSQDVDAAVTRITPAITEIRHHLHRNPELSNREFATARLIADQLRALGLEVDTAIAHTGVVGILRGGRPGPTIAVRADMDALPVTEASILPFASTVTTTYLGQEVGVAHACGHDIHMAVQLGVATVLAGMRDQLPGTVKFIFQPAEEGAPPGEEGGAKLMVDQGVLDGPDAPEVIFGFHTWAGMETGKVGYTRGPALASADRFIATIHGKQAHGASPHLSIDPIVVASQLVTAWQTIPSRVLPPLEPAVLTVGMFRGGTRFNIIPGSVELQGTVRAYSTAVQDTIEHRMRGMLKGITATWGATFDFQYDRFTPATINDPALTDRMVPSLVRVAGEEQVTAMEPWMAAEDFSYFANQIPGFYFRLGTAPPGGTSGDHHTPEFVADDRAIPLGIRLMTALVVDYLGGRR